MQKLTMQDGNWQRYLDFCQKHGLVAKEYKNLLRFQSETQKVGAKC